MSDKVGLPGLVAGLCAPGFGKVRDAFEQNFVLRDEIGAAVAVWVEGDLVVNLWGGSADADGTRPWREDTLASVFSGTKGLSATCVHLLADRGELDLHAPVAAYWPEFGQAGKESITVAMVMGHRSGVIGPDIPLHWQSTTDWDGVCEQLAAADPWWEPGTAQGYHMISFGFILGEVVGHRAHHRTVFAPRSPSRLGVDVHIDHGWGLGYMLNQRRVAGPNPRIFGHGGSGGSFAFVDLEHRIGYAYVMNHFDATKCNADPRSVALTDTVYATLGVGERR